MVKSMRSGRADLATRSNGFSLVELLLVVAIIGTLATISVPVYSQALERARIARAIGDIKAIGTDIKLHQLTRGKLPLSLAEIGREGYSDPWGNPYEYLNFETVQGEGKDAKRSIPGTDQLRLRSLQQGTGWGQRVAPYGEAESRRHRSGERRGLCRSGIGLLSLRSRSE